MTGRLSTSHISDASHGNEGLVQAVEQAADGYFEIGRDYRYREVNTAGARLVGLAKSEIIGHSVLELFPEVKHSEVHAAVQRAMDGGPAESVETYYAPLRLWAINDVIPIDDGVAIFSRDVTPQKHLEQNLSFLAQAGKALAASLDVNKTLQTVANLAVPHIADWCTVDMLNEDGGVDLVALAHVDPERVAWARSLREKTPPDMSAPNGLPNVLRTGESEFWPEITDEMLVAAAKDEESLALIRSIGFSAAMIVPLLSNGKAIGAITFVAAESGHHYLPADLAMAEELASRAARAIDNSRLYEAAQKAIALRDDFIFAASHELRTPITSLKLYTEVLQRHVRKGDVDQVSRNLEKMNVQIDKLALLISDLLDVSKIEAGKLQLRDDEVDINSLAADTIEAIQPTAPKHRIDLEGRVDRTVRGDRDRLGQVLSNLLTNATKYSPSADRVIVRLAENSGGAIVEVEDYGIGIDDEHIGRIFERFYRVSSADEKTFPGLGIGLFISHQIIRRHNGTMSVNSVKGQGSVFRFEIPYGSPSESLVCNGGVAGG